MSDLIVRHILEQVEQIANNTGVRLEEVLIMWGYTIYKGSFVAGLEVKTLPSGGKKVNGNSLTSILEVAEGTHERWGVMLKRFYFDWDEYKLKGCKYEWEREQGDDDNRSK